MFVVQQCTIIYACSTKMYNSKCLQYTNVQYYMFVVEECTIIYAYSTIMYNSIYL
jgi:hypothetical protein